MVDVVVIGGGPGGSSVGSLLARMGYDVLLLEREYFPRHHIGESTLPATLSVLETIGVMDEIRAAGFPVKRGGAYIWGRSREPWIFRFGEVNIGTAFQVERARFDQILLNHARRCGVDVREGHRVTGTIEEDGRIAGVRYVDPDGHRHTVRARWVVDASGQSALMANRRHTRQINEHLKNVAIYGYWHGERALQLREACAEATDDDRNSIFIETIPSGWCWWIPLGETYFSVGAIAGREAITKLSSANRKEFYLERVHETTTIQRILQNCELHDPIRTIQDWSCSTTEFGGPGFLLVGDAAAFVDPILSTGIFLATNFAIAAATVINTILKGLLPEDVCLDWYQSSYNAVYNDYETMVRHWYYGERSQDSWFWRARRALDLDADLVRTFRDAFVLMASGESHSIFRHFVAPERDGLTYFSGIKAMGCMPSDFTLRRVAARLELDLPETVATADEAGTPDGRSRLVLTPADDFTLSYALVYPNDSADLLTPQEAALLRGLG